MAKKDLYMAKSLDELAIRWKNLPDMGNKKWQTIVSSLNKILDAGNENYLKGDEEFAYVLYMKFFAILTSMNNKSEYSLYKTDISMGLGGSTKIIPAMDKLETLKKSLAFRYEKKQQYFLQSSSYVPSVSSTQQKQLEPIEIDIKCLSTISSPELFNRLKDRCTLLIDVRKRDDFEASHIKYPFILNIPGDLIKNGFSAGKIHEMLDPNDKKVWSYRSVKDDVVIMGWNDGDNATQTLKDIMENWDPFTTYKSPIRILKKGYEHFLTLYPIMCTDPHFTVLKMTEDESDNIDDVEYPHIADIVMKDEIRVGAPVVNRANKTNAVRIYEERRDLNDVINEHKTLSEENFKTNQQLEDANESIRSSAVPTESEEYRRLVYKIMELEADKKTQIYKNMLLTNEMDELKKQQSSKLISQPEEPEIIPVEKEIVKPSEPIIKETPVQRTVKIIKDVPLIDRSVKPSLNSYNDYSYEEEQEDCALTGLKNLGNTCYMNSIIQCLFSTLKLRKFLISNRYRDSLNYASKTGGDICEETAGLFKRMNSGEYKSVECSQLKSNFGAHQKMFRGRDQQDAHEFLTIFIDCLHLELNTLNIPRPITNSLSEKYWNEFTKGQESRILQLFYGQIKSTVKCVTCEKESATYETFSNLSLELPSQSNICGLVDCLHLYFGGERINGWICPKCKQKRDAIKKLDISKLPEVLVVHLKRFYVNTEYMSNVYKKKENYVNFPLENVDVSRYLARSELTKSTPKNYQLFAVCNHYGTMESGHYTAFCRRNTKQWFKCDDSSVTPIDQKNVVSCAAYILFYKRCGNMNYFKD